MKKKSRPDDLDSSVTCLPTGYGKLYITITEHEGKIFEIFCTIGHSGQGLKAKAESIGRLCSLVLRLGGKAELIVKTLEGIDGGSPVPYEDGLIMSIPDAVAKAIVKRLKIMEGRDNGLKQINW